MSFDGVPFDTMTLLSNRSFASSSVQGGIEGREKLMLEGVFRLPLPSKCGRDTLCVDITTPGAPDAILRLLNVYLDSQPPPLVRETNEDAGRTPTGTRIPTRGHCG